jgi:hypothetical protein
MIRPISAAEFQAEVPTIVATAQYYATGILNRAFDHPNSGVQVAGALYLDETGEPTAYVTNPARVRDFYRQQDPDLECVDVDCPVEGGRLAMQNLEIYGAPNDRAVRSWMYLPDQEDLTRHEPVGMKQRWVRSESRRFLGNLTLPGYSFDVNNDTGRGPEIKVFIHHSRNLLFGQETYINASNIYKIPPEELITAIAPSFTEQDQELLDYGVETYHAAKIRIILEMMRMAAALPAELQE